MRHSLTLAAAGALALALSESASAAAPRSTAPLSSTASTEAGIAAIEEKIRRLEAELTGVRRGIAARHAETAATSTRGER